MDRHPPFESKATRYYLPVGSIRWARGSTTFAMPTYQTNHHINLAAKQNTRGNRRLTFLRPSSAYISPSINPIPLNVMTNAPSRTVHVYFPTNLLVTPVSLSQLQLWIGYLAALTTYVFLQSRFSHDVVYNVTVQPTLSITLRPALFGHLFVFNLQL